MTMRDEETGKFPAYAWPGGYPIVYYFADGGTCCPACANGENGSEANEEPTTEPGWRLMARDIHYEGAPEICDHCGAAIASAYGDPDETAIRGEG